MQARQTLEDLEDDAQDVVFDALEHDVELRAGTRAERFDDEGHTYGRVRLGELEIVMRPLDPVRDGDDGHRIATLRRVR